MEKSGNPSVINAALSPRIELFSNSECCVEGIRSIIVYNSDCIKLDIGKICVNFSGDDLYITSFTSEGANISGTIISVEFESND